MNTTGKKFGGRKKGTPNIITKELRIVLKNFLFEELKNMPDHLEKLDTKERLELIIKLLPYALPKVTNVSHTTNEPIEW